MINSYIIIYVIIAIVIFVCFGIAIYSYAKKVGKNAATNSVITVEAKKEEPVFTKVLMTTNKGEILLELRQDLMPYTVNNFIRLVKSTLYNGLLFHRVEPFLIQTGDPTTKGLGVPKWSLQREMNKKMEHKKYAVGMARQKGDNTAKTQFYILKREVKSFDGQYAIFGKVIKGFDVIEKIVKGDIVHSIKEV